MRAKSVRAVLLGTSLVVVGVAACTSDSGSSAGACGDIAACYTITAQLDPSSPAACQSLIKAAQIVTLDFSDAPTADGTITKTNPSCSETRSGCDLTVECKTDVVTTKIAVSFSTTGFSGRQTATYADGTTCIVNWTGARLPTCDGLQKDGGTVPTDSGSVSCAGKECGVDGNGNSCGSCSKGFQCSVDRCELDPAGLWTVTIQSGEISATNSAGAAWDVGTPPDPYVCANISGAQKCTTAPADTLTPVWNFDLPTMTGADLQNGFDAEIWDEDVTTSDAICPKARITIPLETFKASTGTFTFGCPAASQSTAKVFAKIAPK
jgi:hypothetical protein